MLNDKDRHFDPDHYKTMKENYRQSKAEMKIMKIILNCIEGKDEDDNEDFQE